MKVFVLIPTRNRKELLLRCIDSLFKQKYKNIEIIIVDDGSTDGTIDILKEKNVTILQGDGNLWWTGAMRKGVDHIMPISNKNDFILIQNDDTYMGPNYIEDLVSKSNSEKRSILGTPLKDKYSGELQYNSHRFINGLLRPVVIDSKNEILSTDTLSGRGVLIPIEVFYKIGNFSKVFPHYSADYDFFCRAKKYYNLSIYTKVITYSTSIKTNLSKSIKSKKFITLKEFYDLFFSRKSSNNIVNGILITFLYTPFLFKGIAILRILFFFFKVFLDKYFLGNLRNLFSSKSS